MNIKGTREQFLNCLQKVSPAAQAGSINPILSNVLLKVDASSVDIIATDQETQIKAPCQVKANKKFDATVSAKKFQDILRRLSADGEVSFDYQESKSKDGRAAINISCGKTRYKLSTLDASDFPHLGERAKFSPLLKLPASDLLNSLQRVCYSSAVNSHRLNLNGVLLKNKVGVLQVVATDGHRMAVQDLPEIKGKSPGEVELILPRKSVTELIRNLPEEGDSEVEIKSSDRVVRFTTGSFELTSSIITESFPDYESVIPRNNDKKVVIAREALLTGLQRVAAIAERESTVVLTFSKGSLALECINAESETANDEISAQYDGEKIEIGFNVSFLTDMFSAVEEDGFEIQIQDSSSSVLIEPAKDKKPAFQYVVMPVRL